MKLENEFTVNAPLEDVWGALKDIERIGPCMPGAVLDNVDGDEFSGRVKVKVGPMTMTYAGSARFTEVDDSNHRAAIEARGKETTGQGTAQATVRAALTEQADGSTGVVMQTDLAITGRPAQFGRGVISDVGESLVRQFADCLSQELAPVQSGSEVSGAAAQRRSPEALDLGSVALMPLLRRLAPVAAALMVGAILVWLARRASSRR